MSDHSMLGASRFAEAIATHVDSALPAPHPQLELGTIRAGGILELDAFRDTATNTPLRIPSRKWFILRHLTVQRLVLALVTGGATAAANGPASHVHGGGSLEAVTPPPLHPPSPGDRVLVANLYDGQYYVVLGVVVASKFVPAP